MKKSSILFSLLAMGITVAQAASVYTITLTSGERFTDCTIIYKSTNETKFSGKNKAGKVVTKKVPQSSIINMREVVKQEEEPEITAPETPSESPVPAAPETPAEQAASGESSAPAAEND